MILDRIFPTITLNRERTRRLIAEEVALRNAAEAWDKAIAESFPSFAKDNDEDQWEQVLNSREPLGYTENDIDKALATALALSYHPGGRAILEPMENFVIGEGPSVISLDENPDVQAYWDEWCVANKWDLRLKEVYRRFLRDGEVFLRWFKPKDTMSLDAQEKSKHLKVRFIEPNEIKNPCNTNNWGHWSYGIETDPDDIEKVVAYYRCFQYTPKGAAVSEQRWERIPAEEISHFKCMVDVNVKRGRSWLLGVAKYIVMHENWLDQRYQLNRLRNLFAVIGNVTGTGGTTLSGLKSQFADTTGKTPSGEGTPKKMPTNAMVLFQKGVEWKLESLNLGASDAAEDGRNFQLMTAAATQLAEYVVRGDASNASYSSTMVAESPMVKMFQKQQDWWRNIQQPIYARVIRYGIETEQLSVKSKKTKEGQLRNARTALRCAIQEGRILRARHAFDRITLLESAGGEQEVSTSTECQVEFPPLIHRDVLQDTQAMVMQRQSGWIDDDSAIAALGRDPEKVKEALRKADNDAMARAKDMDKNDWGGGPSVKPKAAGGDNANNS